MTLPYPTDLLSTPQLIPRAGNGNPLQYSCRENPMDRGGWWARVYRVTKSQTQPSDEAFTHHSYAPVQTILKHTFNTKKRWQECKELYKKDLDDPDNHNGVITHLEPDILEFKVKWALGNVTMNQTSGGDGIPVELFQILKDDAVKVLHSICQQIWKTQQWPQDCKRSVFILIPNKGNTKEC